MFQMTFNASSTNANIFQNLPQDIINKIMTYNYQETPSYHFMKNKINLFNTTNMNNSFFMINKRIRQEIEEEIIEYTTFFPINDTLFISFPTITFKEWIFNELFLKKYNKKRRYYNFTDSDSDPETDSETENHYDIYDYELDF